jgi:hypothetical protein
MTVSDDEVKSEDADRSDEEDRAEAEASDSGNDSKGEVDDDI